jgi:hypothetical protein
MDLLTPPPAEPAPAPAADPAAATPAAPLLDTPPPTNTFTRDLPEGWSKNLGDAFAEHSPTLDRFKSIDDLAKSFLHFRKTGPAYPEENAAPEDVERFRTLARVPESPDGYALAKPENLPEGIEWNDANVKTIAEIAHKHHVPQPALQALLSAHLEQQAAAIAEAQAAQQAEQAAARAEMQRVLGTGHDFARNAGMINHMVTTLADKAGIDPMDPGLAAIGSNPAALKIMYEVVKLTSEDTIRRPSSLGDLRTPAQRATDIMTGKDPELSARYKEGDAEVIRMVQSLLDKK